MKIDKNKPLPEHTKLDYDECCALLILTELFPERYSDLKLADKPDLQGDEIGVEVTIAVDRKQQEALNNWVKAYNCDDENKKQRYVERMSQLGVKYTGGIQSWPGRVPSFETIQEAVDSKVKKLQKGNYGAFKEYELFILTDTWMTEDIIQESKDYFTQNNIFALFNKVYILEKGCVLYMFNADGCNYIKINVTEQSDRNVRARKMVELAEEQ